jgi:Zn finger protein HypA/HybF involved in hydrogenase expression
MAEKISSRCSHCDSALQTEKEKLIGICQQCRSYGLVHGCWPDVKFSFVIHANSR